MKLAPSVALAACLVLTGATARAAAAPAPSLDAARAAVEKARADTARAMQRASADSPTTADLDAAHVALGALKDALDAGAAFEANDLDYAKLVLAVRKELRTGRELVDDRRAKVYIFDQRRAIDQALLASNDKLRAIGSKEPSSKDFEDARAALAALKKAVEDGRQFTKADASFAAYVEKTDASVAKSQKAIDDRWIELSADKQRGLLNEGRKALADALAALSKGGTLPQFDDANRAAGELAKRLDSGKPLEAKDKAYAGEADRTRTELAEARRRMEELLNEAALARLKAEIEPASKDLTAALKGLRGRNPTDDQLAEARTAAIVVRKLVEKFQPQAALSKPFGQYVQEVSKTLVEVEVELQRRSLAAATRDLTQALKGLERRDPADERFEEAKTALTVLEKTLETVHAKDPAISAYAGDARALIQSARATIAQRRVEVDVQRQRAKVEEAKKNANSLMSQIWKADVGADQLAEAEKAIKQLQALLEEGAPLTKKIRDYADYDREVRKRAAELTERLAGRRLQLAASAGRALLTEGLNGAKAKLDAAKQPASTDADIEAAVRSVEAIGKALEGNAALEKQDNGYAAQAERTREELERLNGTLEIAKQARELRKQTVETLAAGAADAQAAAAMRDQRAQKQRYEKAIAQFNSCASAAETLVKENPALVNAVLLVDGNPSTPKAVAALCTEKAKAADEPLKQVAAQIAVEDGPKRAYESGKVLLARSKKQEALDQFMECIATGKIALYRNPEIKDRKFLVAGASITVPELVQQCSNQRDALVAK